MVHKGANLQSCRREPSVQERPSKPQVYLLSKFVEPAILGAKGCEQVISGQGQQGPKGDRNGSLGCGECPRPLLIKLLSSLQSSQPSQGASESVACLKSSPVGRAAVNDENKEQPVGGGVEVVS